MNTIKFNKYQGAGNDFIIIDARRSGDSLYDTELVKLLCDRYFGIGADGLILLLNSNSKDFYMKYFNSDGHESTMCGNGGRCIAAFAKKLGIVKDMTVFSGIDGDHTAYFLEDNQVKLSMVDIEEVIAMEDGYLVDTGSPHFVLFRDSLDEIDVVSEGRKYRNEPRFEPGGANINFVKILSPGEISLRTYERGVEDETLACGTGSVAAVIISYITTKPDKTTYLVNASGGKLKVSFTPEDNNKFTNVWLEGPAERVYDGEIVI